MRQALVHLSLLCAALVACACGRDAGPPATTASSQPGTQAGTPAGPRIVSTVPAATLVLMQLGAIDTIVGVSRYDLATLPPDKQDLPVVGDYEHINYELLLKVRPTALVVYAAPQKVEPRLREVVTKNNIRLVNARFDTLADLWSAADELARLAQREPQARDKIATARAELQRVTLAVAAHQKATADRPRVLYTVARDPVMVVGGRTFLDEVITAAGGTNVGAEVGVGYPVINRELCLKLKPDVVILGDPGAPPPQNNDPRIARWLTMDIPAAKANRVHLLTDPNAQLATLDIAETVRDIARLLHPGAFSEDAFGPAGGTGTTAPAATSRPEPPR